MAVRGTDSPVLKESYAPVVKESPVPAEAVKAEAPAVAEPAQLATTASDAMRRSAKPLEIISTKTAPKFILEI